jgi:hypothetical protein
MIDVLLDGADRLRPKGDPRYNNRFRRPLFPRPTK